MQEPELVRALEMLVNGKHSGSLPCTEAEAEAFHHKHAAWRDADSVQGLGIGEKVTDGSGTGELVLRVYVDQKVARRDLDAAVPSSLKVPGFEERVSTDVQEIGVLEDQSFVDRVRPVQGGMQISHPKGTAGTFGCLAQSRQNPAETYILSNRHVLAPLGIARKYDLIQQPRIADSGSLRSNAIASLANWSRFQFRYLNLFDAAIATAFPGKVDAGIRGLGAPRGSRVGSTIGQRVRICGAASDVNEGHVIDRNFCTQVRYRHPDRRSVLAGFHRQVLCSGYSAPGDSGSLVMDEAGYGIGLHFSGTRTYSVFSPLQPILDEWGLELVTREQPVATGVPVEPDGTELDVFARTLWGEAEGEGRAGQQAVAAVIMNRLQRPARFGRAITGICRAPFQFSCWNQGARRQALMAVTAENRQFAVCMTIAAAAIRGELKDPTSGADHYHAAGVRPAWARGHKPCARIGHHLFYNDIP